MDLRLVGDMRKSGVARLGTIRFGGGVGALHEVQFLSEFSFLVFQAWPRGYGSAL
jgi:hypothetical protein